MNTKRIKKKQVILILYSFTPSDMNFQTIVVPKIFLEKMVTKKLQTLKFLTAKNEVIVVFKTDFVDLVNL